MVLIFHHLIKIKNTFLIHLKKTSLSWAQLTIFMKSEQKNCNLLMLYFYLQYLKKIKII